MKPSWDKLTEEYKGHATVLVADVDCTADGESLCGKVGVEGYPTIKWGDPDDLQDYDGGRELEDMKSFAKENLKPLCSPTNLDLCDDAKKKKITDLQAMPRAELEKNIDEASKKITDAESNFESEVEKLQARYEELEAEKTNTIKDIKESGLGLMKAVLAQAKKAEL